jgi:S1-C subfamily serine protease
MASQEHPGGRLAALSDDLAAAVERAGHAVVTVDARRGLPATGIVWPGDGIVVTADHVVERDEDIAVILPDERRVPAQVAGRDPGSDLAVLRLTGAAPAPATLAPAAATKVGHLVLALGRPAGGTLMASFGIISALGGRWRTARGGTLDGYVRADLALYPGFSGGPLVDMQGRVVGLNSWHLARGEALALPAALAHDIVQLLLTQGRIRRAYLGVTSQPVALPSAMRQQLGLQQESALMVLGVEPGSPAEQGGLLLGDLLLALGGQPVTDAEDLRQALGPAAAGQPTTLTVVRGGARLELAVTPRERG